MTIHYHVFICSPVNKCNFLCRLNNGCLLTAVTIIDISPPMMTVIKKRNGDLSLIYLELLFVALILLAMFAIKLLFICLYFQGSLIFSFVVLILRLQQNPLSFMPEKRCALVCFGVTNAAITAHFYLK